MIPSARLSKRKSQSVGQSIASSSIQDFSHSDNYKLIFLQNWFISLAALGVLESFPVPVNKELLGS